MAVGRKTVAPHQTIASQWGNWLWDQSMQAFANRADRASQFPSPQLGALSTLDDWPGAIHVWDGTRWLAQQRGYSVLATDAGGQLTFTYPHAFQSAPSLLLQGDADRSGFHTDLAPFANEVGVASAPILVRALSTNGITAVPNTSVGFGWAIGGVS